MNATVAGLRSGLGVEDIAVLDGFAVEVIRENVAILRRYSLLSKIYRKKRRAA